MRLSLPMMLTVSLALHGGVAGGLALSRLGGSATAPQKAAGPEMPAIVLISSEETTGVGQVAEVKAAEAKSVAATAPSPLPAQPQVETKPAPAPKPAVTPATTLALEMNPNAHIRALPPEAVLSPSPAPHLDGRAGVVFILDVSGSMYEKVAGATRLAYARDVLSQRIRALKDGTPFAITVYAQTARNSGPLVAASNATREAAVRFILEDIDCGGGTDLPAGLVSAMKLAVGNLVLISDGDLNTTLSNLTSKAKEILNPEKQGPALTVIGIAPREKTEDSALLKSLASLTGGSYVVEQVGESADLVTAAKVTTP